MRIVRIHGADPEVYTTIGPFAMDHDVIRKREHLPIITKPTYTWHVLMEGQKVKAFVGVEEIISYTKLQAFFVLEATKTECRTLIKEVVEKFKRTNSPKLTAAVLKEYEELFVKEKFEVTRYRKNWTELTFFRYEES